MTKLTKWIVFLRTYTASLASHVGMHGVTKPPSAKKNIICLAIFLYLF